MPSATLVLADCLGSATWSYFPDSKRSAGLMTVNSVAVNNDLPLNLDFNHSFKSSPLSAEENAKIIKDLSDILVTVGAININSDVRNNIASQEITVTYTILNVEQDKVDALTTTIASVCEKLVDDLAAKYTCDIQLNGDAAVIEVIGGGGEV